MAIRNPEQRQSCLHVCPLSAVDETLVRSGARHLVSLINERMMPATPAFISPANHLRLSMNDIVRPTDGLVTPDAEHVEQLLAFTERWDRTEPMVVHCWAGISRSTAAAFTIACALLPDRDEMALALALRSASPSAYPNRLLVTNADRILGRDGRMVRAVEAIGAGTPTSEATPFLFPLEV
ncbi:MAG: protein tyrosine phosphatase [Rhizobiales bacterium]|nr:protein tyrosine phosphatase [Hyphomicrobiales bacterium]